MIRAFEDKVPTIGERVYVDVSAQVLADVTLGDDVAVFPGSVIRGDVDPIVIGAGSVVEDGCLLHADVGGMVIGRDVVMGHGAIVHGARVGDATLICMGAIVLRDSVIGEGCLIAAGSVVTEGTQVPPHSVVMGVPGRVVRQTTPEDDQRIREAIDYYHELDARYRTPGAVRAVVDAGVAEARWWGN